MSNGVMAANRHLLVKQYSGQPFDKLRDRELRQNDQQISADLAAAITKQASSQTFLTIRYLVDPPRVDDAYRAYAYFRWVDDILDQGKLTLGERFDFLARQRAIITSCYQGERSTISCPEEQMVVDLIHNDPIENNGLYKYINEMMSVMAIDVARKDCFISQVELDEYTRSLATAVTEALHYFIGHDDDSPRDETRYLAVTGAHITHMLRDMLEDTGNGYFNIPQDYLEDNDVKLADVDDIAFRAWVIGQVQLARACFAAGRGYMARVQNLRCRLAGYAYIARFKLVLDAIEKDGYRLRAAYPERKGTRAKMKMVFTALAQTMTSILDTKPQGLNLTEPAVEMI